MVLSVLVGAAFAGCKTDEAGFDGSVGIWSYDTTAGRFGVLSGPAGLFLDVSITILGASDSVVQSGAVKMRLESGTTIELPVPDAVAPKVNVAGMNVITLWFLKLPVTEAQLADLSTSKVVAAELPTGGQPLAVGQDQLRFEGKLLKKAATCWIERDQ